MRNKNQNTHVIENWKQETKNEKLENDLYMFMLNYKIYAFWFWFDDEIEVGMQKKRIMTTYSNKHEDITLTSFSHNFFNSRSPRMVETISAPWTGGLLYMGRASCCSWLFTAIACFSSSQSTLQPI